MSARSTRYNSKHFTISVPKDCRTLLDELIHRRDQPQKRVVEDLIRAAWRNEVLCISKD